MKKILFKILSFFTLSIPTIFLIKLSGKRIIYPFYHIISDNPPAHIKYLYPVRSIKQFEKDLVFLQKHFTASDFPVKGNNPQFVLSFDDGLSEDYDIIAPILKKRNIPAIFFVNSAFVDNKDMFTNYISSLNKENPTIDFKEYLKNEKPYLTKQQISELKAEGFTIGAHSINHPLFSEITEKEQIRQVQESVNFVIENFGEKQKLFAFPFTDNNVKDTFFDTVFNKNIVDYTFGTAGIKDDNIKNNIQRIPVEKYGLSAKRHIKTEFLLYLVKRVFKKEKVRR